MKNLVIIVGSIIGMMISFFGLIIVAVQMNGTIILNEGTNAGTFNQVTFDAKNILEVSDPILYKLDEIESINIPSGTQICYGIKDGSTNPRVEIMDYGIYETSLNNKVLNYSTNNKTIISKKGLYFDKNTIFVDVYVKDFTPIDSLNLNVNGYFFSNTIKYEMDQLSQCQTDYTGYILNVNKLIEHYNKEVENAKR
ncbi:MAG: hypothetical protein ACRC5R_00420 [Mycoplasmatales bacterium]